MLIFGEPLEGVCTGLRYVFQIPNVFLVEERRVPAKIRTQNIKNLECVRMMNLLRMVLGQKPWHVSLCELSRSPADLIDVQTRVMREIQTRTDEALDIK